MNNKAKHFLITCITLIWTILGGITITHADTNPDLGSQNIMSVAWYQTAAEAKALYLQGYNVARQNLDNDLQQPSNKPRAIILDIDETVLDNSPYQAYNALHNTQYPYGWKKWCESEKACAVPGAKDFLNYANSKGVQIYYITNRSSDLLKATEQNLIKQGLPQANNQHVILQQKKDKSNSNSKQSRRQQIENNNNVLMYIGDSLTDFNDPQKPTVQSRYQDVMQNQSAWGTKYIILPNPMYGGWEAALYNNNYNISKSQMIKDRRNWITYYNPKNNKIENKTVTEQ